MDCSTVVRAYGGAANHYCDPGGSLPFTGISLLGVVALALIALAVGVYLLGQSIKD